MKAKTCVSFLCVLFLCGSVFGERTLSSTGNKISGWTKNSDGNWTSNAEPMITKPDKKASSYYGYDIFDKFFSFDFEALEFEGKTYTVLRKVLPWTNATYFWAFPPGELEKLKTIKDGQPTIIKINVTSFVSLGRSDLTLGQWLSKYPEDFKKYMKPDRSLYIDVFPSKELNEVKFLIFGVLEETVKKIKPKSEMVKAEKHLTAEEAPVAKKKKSPEYIITKKYNVEGLTDPEGLPFETLTSANVFDYVYYQTSYEDFNSFLKLDASEPSPDLTVKVNEEKNIEEKTTEEISFDRLLGKIIRVKTLDTEYEGFDHYIGKVAYLGKMENVFRLVIEPCTEPWVKKIAKINMGWIATIVDKKIYPSNERVYQIYIMEEGKDDVLFFDNPRKAAQRINSKKEKEREISIIDRRFRGLCKDKDGQWIINEFGSIMNPNIDETSNDYNKLDNTSAYRLHDFGYEGEDFAVLEKVTISPSDYFTHYFWVFPKKELEKLKNVNDGRPNIIKINVTVTKVLTGNYSIDMLRKFLGDPVNFKSSMNPSRALYLLIYPKKAQGQVNFLIFAAREEQVKKLTVAAEAPVQKKVMAEAGPVQRVKPKKLYSITTRNVLEGFTMPDAFLFNIVTTEKVFDFAYYQTSYGDFNYFLKLEKD